MAVKTMKKTKMMDLLKRIYPHRMSPNSPGLDEVAKILCEELPFTVREYDSGMESNGWVVPDHWHPEVAEIRKDGKLIYDGMAHPLGVIGYSRSFEGKIGLDELKEHLYFHPKFDDVLVYHCELFYKVGREACGMTVPKTLYDSLEPGEYDVKLKTVHEEGTMKVCDYFLPGRTKETIILNSHTCHAGQANDDIAGLVVAVEVMRRLSERDNRFSYRLIAAPEHFGTVFYLAGLSDEEVKDFKYAMFLEMLGNDNVLALQETFTGKSDIDLAAHHVLRHMAPDYRSGPFRSIVGNDETVWEAPGYEIPTISLSRFPYEEYHSSRDDDKIIKEEKLEEAADVVMAYLDALETDCVMERRFKGLVALSNPKYDLYIGTMDPSIRPKIGDEQKRWNRLMDYIPRYFDGKKTVLEIAREHDLPYDKVLEYVRRFEAKGLVEMKGGNPDVGPSGERPEG